MIKGQLRDYFIGVGAKRLSAVDAEPSKSNQHEVGTTKAMRNQFLGEANRNVFTTTYVRLTDDDATLIYEGTTTHYDTRFQQNHRSSEWRLYYRANPITDEMREGDGLFLALSQDQRLFFIVTPQGSTSERQLSWLFGLNPSDTVFQSREFESDDTELSLGSRLVFDELGFELEDTDMNRLDSIIEPYGSIFPRTDEFSKLARDTLPEVTPEDDPDGALVAWVNHEESLFRRLEHRVVALRIEDGFRHENEVDVDGFLKFSLSVQNRRKSRMGYSLENHLDAVLKSFSIPYDRQAKTENNYKPDFLFPSEAAYRNATRVEADRLVMLGVKSTCKDRWRQVLSEALKIEKKHLLTLEPGISERQTNQMEGSNLQLVVPHPIHQSYTEEQRQWLWTLAEFITEVKKRRIG